MKLYKVNLCSIILLLCICIVSCKKTKDKFENPIIVLKSDFDSIQKLDKKSINIIYHSPSIIDKYKFGSIVYIYNNNNYFDTFNEASLYRRTEYENARKYEDQLMKSDLNYDSLLIRLDNKTLQYNYYSITNDSSKAYEYYPCYIVNETKRNRLFNQSYSVIQEAQDSFGIWYPLEIECKWPMMCGDGWNLIIHPKEFALILIHKYSGTFKTKIRVRIKNEDAYYISNSVDGCINYSQFYLNKSTNEYKACIKDIDKSLYDKMPKNY